MTTINAVTRVRATPVAGVFIVNADFTTSDGERMIADVGVTPTDMSGVVPLIREWLDENAGTFTIEPYVPPAQAPAVITVHAVDLWSRLSEAEADQVEAAMATQPARTQNIFRSASSYRSDHDLWPLLVSIAEALFGAERAAEILGPSV